MTPERRRWAVAMGIALAAVQSALLVVMAAGGLAPVATAADLSWYAVWLVYTLAGVVVLERVPRSAVGWLLCTVGTLPMLGLLLALAWGDATSTLTQALYLLIPPLLLVALPAVFPDGGSGLRVRRPALVLAAVLAGLGLLSAALTGTTAEVISTLVVGGSALVGLVLLAGHVRLASRSAQPARAQHTIFLAGFAAVVVVMLLGQVVTALAAAVPGSWVQLIGLACLPAAVALAMVGAGLWGTDLAHGRRLARVGLAGLPAVLGSVLLVAVVGALLPRPGLAALVAAAGALALAATTPYLWRSAGRRLYGTGVVDGRGGGAPGIVGGEGIPTDEDGLAALVAAALRSPHATITTTPLPATAGALVVPVDADRHLAIAPRRAGESFTRRDREVATRLAAEVATHLQAAQARAQLEAARVGLAAQRRYEQQRLRAVLHDTVGPLLVGAEMQARALRDTEGTPEAADLHDSLREAREAMRAILDEGSPRALAAGLIPTVTELTSRWQRPPVTLIADLDDDTQAELSMAASTTAYLVVAEALANVSQHAQASTCQVRLAREGDRLAITVEDDGRGMDPDRTPGLGLASLRGRALELGGDLHVGPGETGTVLAAHLPIGAS